MIGWMLGASNKPPRRSTGLALRLNERNRRLTNKLQILSWNPGPARGSDPSTQATHLIGAWHVVCVQKNAGFVTDSSMAENFHTTPGIIALLSSTRTRFRAISRARRSRSLARSGTLRGSSKAWLSRASSAGRTKRRALISRSPTFTSTTSPPSGGLFALRCCCSSATCA